MIVFSAVMGPLIGYLIGQLVGIGLATRLYGHIYAGRVLDAGLKDSTWLSISFWSGMTLQVIGGIAAMGVLSALGWSVLLISSIIVGTKKSVPTKEKLSVDQSDSQASRAGERG